MEVTYRISTKRTPGRGLLPGYKEEISTEIGTYTSKSKLIRASDVVITPVNFFWRPYLAFGKLTMLSGDPGAGKSFITHAIAAAVSNGDPLPGQEGRTLYPMNALLIGMEDKAEDTLAPRLLSLNANMDRVFLYQGFLHFDDAGMKLMKDLMQESKARLFVIDPIVAYLGSKMDMNRSNEVRPIMNNIKSIAEEFDAVGIIVRHLRKASPGAASGHRLSSGMGSMDFTASVRGEWQTSEGKDGTLYLDHIKSNMGPKGKSIIYSIIDDEFHFGGQVEPFTMAPASRVSRKYASEDRARQFLFDLLKDKPEGAIAGDIYLAAKAAGIGERALRNARATVAIVAKSGKAGWVWKLNPNAPLGGLAMEGEDEHPNG